MRRAPLLIVTALCLLAPAFAGCLGTPTGEERTPDVLASFYPLAYLAQRIGGDNLTVGTLVGPGIEPHDWEPSLTDLTRISGSEVVLVQGLGFEPWLDNVRASMPASKDPFVVTTQNLTLREGEHDHDHGHDEEQAHEDEHADSHDAAAHENESAHGHENETAEEHEAHEDGHADSHDETTHADEATHENESAHDNASVHGHENETEEEHEAHAEDEKDRTSYDPHTWLDPALYARQAANVEQALSARWPEHAPAFRERLSELQADLHELDEAYHRGLRNCQLDFIIANHDAYGYLEAAYGFEVEPVSGISPEAEPDAQTVARLVDLAQEHNVTVIYTEELVEPRVARVIAKEVGAKTLTLSPIEGLTPEAAARGEDYMSLMRMNLEHLREGLQCG